MMLENALVLSAYLFSIDIYALIISRNMVRALMSLELVPNMATINFITFFYFFNSRQLRIHFFSIFVTSITAIKAAIGPAIVSSIYYNRKLIYINQSNLLNK